MALPALTSTEAVEKAMDEFDELGQEAFLAKSGYGPAKRYFVERTGTLYDSKALWGVAVGYQRPERGLRAKQRVLGRRHLLVKWSARLGSGGGETVENHIRVAEKHGAVWWGLWTLGEADHRVGQQWVDRLRNQIAEGTSTHVFVSGITCWTTLQVVYTREETEEDLIPSYYSEGTPQKYYLWVKLTTSSRPTATRSSATSMQSARRPADRSRKPDQPAFRTTARHTADVVGQPRRDV